MTDPVILHRLTEVESAVELMAATQASVADSLRKLVVLETHHVETRAQLGRAFETLGSHGRRISEIEKKQPTYDWVARAVGTFVITTVGAVLVLVWDYVTGAKLG